MKLSHKTLSFAAAAVTFSQVANAQVMTEIRISTAGIDEEFIEIQGTSGQSTDGLMIAAVESDAGGPPGTLDKIYDLAGFTFPASDPFFVIGSDLAEVRFPGTIDLLLGVDLFENSSQTIYLLNVPDGSDRGTITALSGLDVTSPVGSTTTIFASMPGVTILDAVSIFDTGAMDVAFDGTPVFGPDSSFIPSGIFRPGGCPSDWCSNNFLNFMTDGIPNPPYSEPTPGAVNPTDSTCANIPSIGAGTCGGGSGVPIGMPYCPVNNNSTGVPAALIGFGTDVASSNNLRLDVSAVPAMQFGFFLNSQMSGFAANIGTNGQGNLCLDPGSVGRFNRVGEILQVGANGQTSFQLDLTDIPRPMTIASVNAGETWYFQFWFRDFFMMANSSNLTNGLEVTFQ